jgi:hypothetical protein
MRRRVTAYACKDAHNSNGRSRDADVHVFLDRADLAEGQCRASPVAIGWFRDLRQKQSGVHVPGPDLGVRSVPKPQLAATGSQLHRHWITHF